ncbi:alkyl/aryl-sulfatase [Phenylobacterium sp.]|uniref:alkyl/aryl-sulfatase n=1 Tax=Phenylobacterium sp. TaxID=1871053 RepID=UPI0035B18AA5
MRKALVSLTLALAATPALAAPDFNNRQDFDFADRGFVATRKDPLIKGSDGRVIWDLTAYDFLKAPAPATANPSLWRQSQLLTKHGLFKVSEGVWQVRGFDISNVTFIAGKTGWIVIDPLTSAEVAKAAYDLVTENLGAKPVVALIYTHSHTDHFGGGRGLVSQADVDAGKIQIIAPDGFLEHAVSENIIAGAAMGRRATYQFGYFLPKGPTGQLSAGIGAAISPGTQTLIPPNVTIKTTGQEMTVDGVRLQFQVTPGTEAPAEMNIYLPDLKALCMAENANASQHNLLTPRGALVRDAKAWADYLTESLRLYGDKTDVMFTSHAWPRFGQAQVDDFLAKHRDAYKFLHDQSVRMMNEGLTGPEIANRLKLPPALDNEWYNRGYYGSLSFNSRAVYQRYMGWYDANPVNLAPLEPADESARYVAAMGGEKKVLAAAKAAHAKGDDRWAAQLLNRLVYANAKDQVARNELAGVYDAMAYATENAIWRNMYLSAATELRNGVKTGSGPAISLDLVRNMTTPMLLDLMSVRLNADKAGADHATVDLVFPDRKEHFRVAVANGVLTWEANPASGSTDATLTLNRPVFLMLTMAGGKVEPMIAGGQVKLDGDAAAFGKVMGWMDAFKADFPIVWRP